MTVKAATYEAALEALAKVAGSRDIYTCARFVAALYGRPMADVLADAAKEAR